MKFHRQTPPPSPLTTWFSPPLSPFFTQFVRYFQNTLQMTLFSRHSLLSVVFSIILNTPAIKPYITFSFSAFPLFHELWSKLRMFYFIFSGKALITFQHWTQVLAETTSCCYFVFTRSRSCFGFKNYRNLKFILMNIGIISERFKPYLNW